MGAIKLDSFVGMVPSKDALSLPANAAEECVDVRLGSGTLRGWHAPLPVHTLRNPKARSVFRIPEGSEVGRAPNWANSIWLEFEDANTDLVPSPVSDDRHGRIYWSSPSLPAPRYNSYLRMISQQPDLVLGVPAPANALNVSAPDPDTSSPPTVRSYVFTYVTSFGEEGPPSPPVTRTGKQTGGWAITFPAIPSADTTDRVIAKRRVYRTVTGSNGVADFFQVGEYSLSDGSVTDYIDDAVVTQSPALASETWSAPPALMGVVALPNGVLAGWTAANEVWFCEPYRPHAWPGKYSVTFPHTIVGLGVAGGALFVLTDTIPFVMTGANPGSMRREPIELRAPCLSRRSITSAQDGVYYASTDGLIAATGGGLTPSTFNFAGREDWLREVNPYDFRAVRVGSTYYAFTESGSGVLLEIAANGQSFSKISRAGGWVNAQIDVRSGGALLIGGGVVSAMDGAEDRVLRPYRWRSKVWHAPKADNLGAAKVFFRAPPSLPNPAAEVANPTTLSEGMWGIVRILASLDGGRTMTPIYVKEMRESGALLRPPAGFKSEFWQVEIEARVEVTSVQIASSVRELAAA